MIAVDARLRIETAGLHLRIDGNGSILRCRLSAAPSGIVATLRRRRQLFSALRTLVPILERAGLRLDIMVGSLVVGRAGSGVRANAAGRLLGLPATRLGA